MRRISTGLNLWLAARVAALLWLLVRLETAITLLLASWFLAWALSPVIAGGQLFGFLGTLLAVPAAAALRVGLDEALPVHRGSKAFFGEGP